jgi:hypothetical protein
MRRLRHLSRFALGRRAGRSHEASLRGVWLDEAMIGRLAFTLGLLLLLPVAAQASLADLFQQYDHGTVADKNIVKALIIGIANGFNTANDELKDNNERMLYCAPETIKFTDDLLIDILRRWVEANRAKVPRIDAAPPATALLYALEDAFPCTK